MPPTEPSSISPNPPEHRLTVLAARFLADGLVVEHEGWQLIAGPNGGLRERGGVVRHGRTVSAEFVRECLGWLVFNADADPAALASALAFWAEGLRRADMGEWLPHVASRDAVRAYLYMTESALVQRMALQIAPEDGAALIADALVAGMTLSTGDRESWSTVHFDDHGNRFISRAGDHFGPEGDRDDAQTRAQFIHEWQSRGSLVRGRLEGGLRRAMDQALTRLGVATLRQVLAARQTTPNLPRQLG